MSKWEPVEQFRFPLMDGSTELELMSNVRQINMKCRQHEPEILQLER